MLCNYYRRRWLVHVQIIVLYVDPLQTLRELSSEKTRKWKKKPNKENHD